MVHGRLRLRADGERGCCLQIRLRILIHLIKRGVGKREYAGFINDEGLGIAGGDYFFEGRQRNIPSGYESPFSRTDTIDHGIHHGLHEAYYFYPYRK